ncbi:GntR family transcriptional regulator [Mycobacterium sp. SMC-4]|uniref:GntR family transcriptional regulator n=1 Tax=Mycobacterium sp. SMC-4 TaxID=2857059 RepID=UPI0021B19120|nr:GntR family transcriptional regulator [Mycobacterium sp. SMC-4]UXA18580.1 GntR family transcriptional regulator [Mycobacterium sp. SMC-4]
MTRIRRGTQFTAHLVNSSAETGQPRVTDDIRDAILSGDQPPGTAIPVDAVAAHLGVSQIPVREALMTLVGEGLVEHRPHVGYRVATLTFEEFTDLYRVREVLEAGALAASIRHATAQDDAEIWASHHGLDSAIRGHDDRIYHSESRRLHLAMIRPSRMGRLVRMYESAWNLTEPARPMAHVSDEARHRFHSDHGEMISAFVARDGEALAAASQRHYEHLRAEFDPLRDDADLFRRP